MWEDVRECIWRHESDAADAFHRACTKAEGYVLVAPLTHGYEVHSPYIARSNPLFLRVMSVQLVTLAMTDLLQTDCMSLRRGRPPKTLPIIDAFLSQTSFSVIITDSYLTAICWDSDIPLPREP